MAMSLISCLFSLDVSQGWRPSLHRDIILLMFCDCNCTRFANGKCRVIARFDSVHTIGNFTLVDSDIQCDGFECRELRAIA